MRWLVGETPCDVVDLGAGTGKLTRSLVALGHRVTAVEPLEGMLEQLRRIRPGADRCRAAPSRSRSPTARRTSSSCAQAFHWFDHGRALAEIARVLRPGGRLALVWNTRDDTEAWVAELTDTVIGRSEFREGGVAAVTASIDESGLYGLVEQATFAHVQLLGRGELLELVRSRSQCAVLSEEERHPCSSASARSSTATPRTASWRCRTRPSASAPSGADALHVQSLLGPCPEATS